MGCSFSSTSSSSLRPCTGTVRVIHTNGYVEDFPGPGVVTVAHVTGCCGGGKQDHDRPAASPPRYVLCSSAHLLQPGRGAFRPEDPLQPGTVYFLLPHSVFQAESSAVDLACLMNRLTALARKGCAASAPGLNPLDALLAGPDHHGQPQPQPRPLPRPATKEQQQCAAARPAPWRPCLDRIDESIGRSSMRSASSRSACSEA